MIPPEELRQNAKELLNHVNGAGIVGLGCIIIFFDAKHGNPAVAINCQPEAAVPILEACASKLKVDKPLIIRPEEFDANRRR